MYYAIIRISDTKTIGVIWSIITTSEYNSLNIITPVGYYLVPITYLIPMGDLVDFEMEDDKNQFVHNKKRRVKSNLKEETFFLSKNENDLACLINSAVIVQSHVTISQHVLFHPENAYI